MSGWRTARRTRRGRPGGRAIDVTLPSTRVPVGARHPITILAEHIADTFVAMGWGAGRGARGGKRAVQLRRAELPAGSPGPQRIGHLPHRAGGDPGNCCAPTPPRYRSAPCSTVSCRSTSSRSAEPSRTDELDSTHTRCSTRSRASPSIGADHGASARHVGRLRRSSSGPTARTRMRPHFFRSPNPRPKSTSGSRTRRAVPAGWSGAAAAWSTPTCCAPPGSTRRSTRLRLRLRTGANPAVPQRYSRYARHGRGRRAVLATRSGWGCNASAVQLASRGGAGRNAGLGCRPADLEQALIRVGHEVEDVITLGPVSGPLRIGRVTGVEELTGFRNPSGPAPWTSAKAGTARSSVGNQLRCRRSGGGGPAGAVLPGDFQIATRTTYGRTSDGMICSAAELGLGSGIRQGSLRASWCCRPGPPKPEPTPRVLGLDDVVFDLP